MRSISFARQATTRFPSKLRANRSRPFLAHSDFGMAEPVGQKPREARPLIYRPPPRWHFWPALGTALGIHLAAVVASQRRGAPAGYLSRQPPQAVEAVQRPPAGTPAPGNIPVPAP